MDIKLSCSCGQVQGRLKDVNPERVSRARCYCRFCQAYATHLQPESDRLLDEMGGSDLLQLSPADIVFDQGKENIGCLKLTDKGVLRYYASCCRSPLVGTVPKPKVPFVSVSLSALPELPTETDRRRVLGPVRIHAFVPKDLKAQLPEASRLRNARGLTRLSLKLLNWVVKGDAGRSPFWLDGKPLVEAERVRWKPKPQS